jgi:hypothetical protein
LAGDGVCVAFGRVCQGCIADPPTKHPPHPCAPHTISTEQLVISEWGIGGGTQDGSSIAKTLEDVAGYPFFGLWCAFFSDGGRRGRRWRLLGRLLGCDCERGAERLHTHTNIAAHTKQHTLYASIPFTQTKTHNLVKPGTLMRRTRTPGATRRTTTTAATCTA